MNAEEVAFKLSIERLAEDDELADAFSDCQMELERLLEPDFDVQYLSVG